MQNRSEKEFQPSQIHWKKFQPQQLDANEQKQIKGGNGDEDPDDPNIIVIEDETVL